MGMMESAVSSPLTRTSTTASSTSSTSSTSQVIDSADGGRGERRDQGQGSDMDLTTLPAKLDAAFLKMDKPDAALRSTIIKAGSNWTKKFQKSLLSCMSTCNLDASARKDEKNSTFDLLDALTRSGVLALDSAELHVVLCATHCFDTTLIDTVIKNNINPIEKVERSTVIMATTVHGQAVGEMVSQERLENLTKYSPTLLL